MSLNNEQSIDTQAELGEFILIYTGLDRGICLLIFLGQNARGFGIKRLEMV